MTEDEWVRAEDEEDLWRALAPLGSRRRRLLASALIRAIGRCAVDPAITAALEVSDRFGDGGETNAAMKRARDALFNAMQALERTPTPDPGLRAEKVRRQAARLAAWYVCDAAVPGAGVREAIRAMQEAKGLPPEDARRRLYPVYREVAGPAPPVAFDPAWRTATAVQLARQMYEAREFAAMPILADALQDAGCEDADVLGHCRDPQAVHVRGCWVVDLVLGKT